MNLQEIAKVYSPKEVEDKWYQYWMNHNYFHSEVNEKKVPYSIVIPPPNVTDVLHMGHAYNNTIQDIFIRFYRMKGREAMWLPGTDHAGIATQNVVERYLKKEENLTRQQEQSRQIEHENDSQIVSRRIIVRSRYLEPLSNHLCSLYTAIDKYTDAIISVINPYYIDRAREEVKVPEADKKAFIQGIEKKEKTFMEIFDPRSKVSQVSAQAADHRLTDKIKSRLAKHET